MEEMRERAHALLSTGCESNMVDAMDGARREMETEEEERYGGQR